jgi:hypothetical protein
VEKLSFLTAVRWVIIKISKIYLTLIFLAPTAVSYWDDRPWRFIYTPWFWDDTQYSQGFSENKFQTIRVDDTKEHVLSILGEPLEEKLSTPFKNKPNLKYIYLVYARRGGRSNFYFRRDLRINANTKKVEYVISALID